MKKGGGILTDSPPTTTKKNNAIMKKLSNKAIYVWMIDRTMEGINHEEIGSTGHLEDADDFRWCCCVGEENGQKVVNFTTSICPIPFAVGKLTKTGKPRISWK